MQSCAVVIPRKPGVDISAPWQHVSYLGRLLMSSNEQTKNKVLSWFVLASHRSSLARSGAERWGGGEHCNLQCNHLVPLFLPKNKLSNSLLQNFIAPTFPWHIFQWNCLLRRWIYWIQAALTCFTTIEKRDIQSEGDTRLVVSIQTDGPLKAFNGAMI